MMDFRLSINTGFAVNRFTEPEEWTRVIGEELGLRSIQMTADLLNPDLPSSIIAKEIKKIRRGCEAYNTNITGTFTGQYTRLNHLAHPNRDIRAHWIQWFKKLVDISVDLGAETMGSHFGIFTYKDNQNEHTREERRKQNIEGWHEIGLYAREKGLQYLCWEPMSIAREQGETIPEARRLQTDVNKNAPLPFHLCLDVDHGNVVSPDPQDTDPYAWLKELADESPLIHIKQSSFDKSAHHPFTRAHNEKGRIHPEKVIKTVRESTTSGKFNPIYLIIEVSLREREPTDSLVLDILKESVDYWRPHVPD